MRPSTCTTQPRRARAPSSRPQPRSGCAEPTRTAATRGIIHGALSFRPRRDANEASLRASLAQARDRFAAESKKMDDELKDARRQAYVLREELDSANRCVVCNDAPKVMLLLPCKHLCLCASCLEGVKKMSAAKGPPEPPLCPLCRSEFKSQMEIKGLQG